MLFLHAVKFSGIDSEVPVNVKVATVAAFRQHVSHRLTGMWAPELQTLACTASQSIRRLRFWAFRCKQRFFSKIARYSYTCAQ